MKRESTLFLWATLWLVQPTSLTNPGLVADNTKENRGWEQGIAPWRTTTTLRDSGGRHHGVVGKWVGEVVGIEGNCFEVIGRRGTHRGGCSTVMAVG
jgi:hypothetical protein